MSTNQRTVVLLGLFATFFIILVPPWLGASYGLIFDPPTAYSKIDIQRLAIQLALVAIFCGALFLMAKPDSANRAGGEDGKQGEKPLSRQMTIVLVAFVIATIGATGWHFYNKHAANEREQEAARIQAAAEAKRLQAMNDAEAERQRREVELTKRKNEAATQAALATAKMEQDQQAAGQAKLASLARPKRFNFGQQAFSGVNGLLQVYWKDNILFYQLKLQGSAEKLEYASGAHPTFRIALVSRDGLAHETLCIDAATLQPLKGRRGAITGVVSPNQNVGCSMETFEGIVAVRLVE